MAAADAQLYWMSARVPNDQFLLFGFDGSPDRLDDAVAELHRRAEACDELRLRVVDDARWRYPRWGRGGVEPEQFLVAAHPRHWQGCLNAVVRFDQLDPRRMTWRANVFPEVTGVPNVNGPG